MKFNLNATVKAGQWLLVLILGVLPCVAHAQLTMTAGVQKYGSLSGTTVNMSGKCELWVTNSSTPLTGCTINLNSVDSYVVLPGVKPSSVVSTYLNQIRINGAVAVADNNCRVVEYAMGAIVVPHPSSFQPLTIYDGPNFTGASMTLGQWTYYKSGLGLFYANFSSFKLKRGYMAVMAQAENGTGISKCYVAQDGDMDVSVLPSTLDHNIRFIYVTPWRWTSKKATAGWPGNVMMPNVQSWYGWRDINSSTRDLEYTAMQWGLFLPNLDLNNWQSEQVNTILGYNEPDHSDQSRMSVSQGIAAWPKLEAAGLRLGSPATAEGGDWWFSPFMSQADASNLRVDFVTIHDYACHNPADPAGAATQLYNYLKNYYNTYKRPIWLTEWNSGANWTTCGDPTAAQEQALVGAMINMLDNTPWVEHYCIYNWVEASRAVVDGSGNLTPAGTTYAAEQSPIGYLQVLQSNGTRSFSELRFENNVLDSSGYGNNGMAAGSPAYVSGVHGQAIVFDGTNTVVTLPQNIANTSAFTFAAWVKWAGGGNWQRIFDFGNGESEYMFLTPSASSGKIRFAIKDVNLTEQNFDVGVMPSNQWVHIAVTLGGGTATIYTNGVQAGSASITFKPSDFAPRVNSLGRSQFIADPKFSGRMDDVFIADNALTATAIAKLVTNTPPQFGTNFITGGSATQGVVYSGSLAGAATDSEGQAVGYAKVTGPAWLNIGSDGTLTGTPTAADEGTNYFTVTVTDSNGGGPGQHAYAVLAIEVTTSNNFSSGVWTADASANWSASNAWLGGIPPSGPGQTADFSSVNITANRTVMLDSSLAIGTLQFGDASGGQSWTITNNSGSTLTLDSGSGAQPSIAVTNPVTIAASLAGTNGFTKIGAGTLTLSGNNLYLSGNLDVAQGTVTIGGQYALGTGPLTMRGGAISNATGSYTMDNRINLGAAGSFNVAAGASLTLTGVITNSGGLIKNGAGTLMLAGVSTYTGNTVLNAGTLQISSDGSTPLGHSTLVINGGSLDNIVIRNFGLPANNAQIWNGDFSFIGTQDLDMGAGTVTVNGTRQVTVNANTFQLDGLINGTGRIVKSGAGILYLSGTGIYSGGTTLTAGELQLANSQVLGSGGLTLNGGTLTARGGNRTLANAVTVGGDFTLNGANAGANALTLSGGVNLSGGIRTITVDATPNGAILSGPVSNGGLTKAGAGPLTLSAINSFSGDTRVAAGTLTLANSSALQNSVFDLNASDAGTLNFGLLTSATLGGLKGSRNLSLLNASSVAVSLTVGGNGQASTFSGTLSGSGNLTKIGAGTLTLAGANILTGATRVNAGTLFINGSQASGALIASSGGTLGGTGNIGGPVSVQSGGIIAPGTGTIGTLTVNNSLTLAAGGALRIRISKNGGILSNDSITGLTSFVCSGTLIVTNVGTEPLAAGDTFQLLNASNPSGSYAAINLPSLGSGLTWNTNDLATGLISVMVTVKPQFNTVNQTGDGAFHFTGTGAAGVNYELDAATNLVPPISWAFVTNTVADQNGYFEFWDFSSTNFSQRFYQIKQAQ